MDAARQILRFSIPGSVLLLAYFAFFAISRRCQGVHLADSAAGLKMNISPVVGIAATIPIGFLVYQLYYFNYGPVVRFWPFPWGGSLVRMDRGSQVLHRLPKPQRDALSAVFGVRFDLEAPHVRAVRPRHWWQLWKVRPWLWYALKMLHLKDSWKRGDRADRKVREERYAKRWHRNWDALRAVVDIAASTESTRQIRAEYIVLSDLYHALGACRTATALAWLACVVDVYVLHPGRILDRQAGAAAGFVIVTALAIAMLIVIQVSRGRTWKSAASSMAFSLRWLLRQHPELFITQASPDDAKLRGMFQLEGLTSKAKGFGKKMSRSRSHSEEAPQPQGVADAVGEQGHAAADDA